MNIFYFYGARNRDLPKSERQNKIKGISGKSKKEHKQNMISKGISLTMIFQNDDGEFFAPYCSFQAHQGFIGKQRLEEKACMDNGGCEYLRIFKLVHPTSRPYTCVGFNPEIFYK